MRRPGGTKKKSETSRSRSSMKGMCTSTHHLCGSAQRTFTRELGTGYFKKATRPAAKLMQLPAFKLVNFFVGTPVNLAKSGIRLDPITGIGSYFQDPKKIPGLPRLIKEYQEKLASTDWATRTRAVGEARTGGQILAAFSLLALADEDNPNHPVVLNGPSYHKSSLNKSPRFQRKLPNSLGFLKYDENGDPVIGADGKPAIRFGLAAVKNVGYTAVEPLVRERKSVA